MWLRKFSGYYLVIILAFCAGTLSAIFEVWPYSSFKSAKALFSIDPHTGETLGDRFDALFDIRPARALVKYTIKDRSGFEPVPSDRFAPRRGDLLMRKTRPRLPGHLFLYGAFDFTDGLFGAVLLDPEGRLVHTWKVTQDDVPGVLDRDINKFPHGVEILPDGSLIFAFDHGEALQRIDACSRRQWANMGIFHHAVTLTDGMIWTLRYTDVVNTTARPGFVKIDPATGKTLSEFTLEDIRKANPDLSIFDIRQADYYDKPVLLLEPYHSNDVEPLPARFADAFEQFEAGDLVISLRSLNLIFVIDPETLMVKWRRSGNWRRQHDPDWLPDGRLSVLDNSMYVPPSRIVAIDPKTNETNVLFNGAQAGFYTWIMGKHQNLPDGEVLITSPQQGRAFAVDKNGRIFLEVLNLYDGNKRDNLVISEARFLADEELSLKDWPKCE